MVRVRYTAAGGRYRTGGHTFEDGDEHDLPQGLAQHLVEDVGDFEYVDDEPVASPAASDADEPRGGADTSGGDSDVSGFNRDEWLEQDYQTRADRVEAGEVDDHLDTIADVETSDTVTDAIGIRRAELAED